MPGRPLTVLFMPESAYGPTNNCIGIGDVLRRRGHRVVFAAEASWKGRLEPLGFEEDLVDLSPPPEQAPQDAGAFWKEFIASTAPEFRKPTIEQLDTWIKPVWAELISGARYCQEQLAEIVARTRPDVIVEDNVISFPALLTAGVPFVRIVSCNPLEVADPALPPAFSGYPAGDQDQQKQAEQNQAQQNQAQWPEFRAEYDRVHRAMWAEFSDWVASQGAPPLPDLEFIHSGQANLYVYPEIADYRRSRPLGPGWHRLDSSVRETDEPFTLPGPLAGGGGALIYFSLGSLGSADVALMRRVIDSLAATPHRYIVSKGPLHAELDLASNMYGAEFLPQTSVIPRADLVITHGGNNTTTECLHFGKPMIVLPLFWDQHDNAQRVDELGLGVRLDAYRFTDAQLHGALARLLGDTALRDGLARTAANIQRRQGLRRAADVIESTAGS
ncbi:MAG TPA: nucleotide disphospho-sugar-binding domain-containing protein [Streptosporangiaceae bacterium]|jgi:MGT family glycosyltransferase|nr:nucleotide disphospho-sugar-binding domain-containing protein [Streptosporangiaceae bacterium]